MIWGMNRCLTIQTKCDRSDISHLRRVGIAYPTLSFVLLNYPSDDEDAGVEADSHHSC